MGDAVAPHSSGAGKTESTGVEGRRLRAQSRPMFQDLVPRPRTWIALAAVAFVLADVAIVALGVRGDFAFDFACCYQQAGQRLLDGRDLYEWSATYTFRYSPWAALLFTPLAPLTAGAAAVVWVALKTLVLGVAAAWYASVWPAARRPMVAAAVVLFPPAVHDLMIGNVSVFTLVVLLALARNVRWAPVAFGAMLLLAPKPHLLPVVAWLAVARPRDAVLAIGTTAVATLAGLAVFGVEPWLGYVRTFGEPLGREFTANIGFSGVIGPAGVVVGVVAAAVVLALALQRRGTDGLSLAILSGALLGPYVFIHYLIGTIVAAEGLLRTSPRRLAPFPLLMLVAPLTPIWLLLLAALQWRTRGSRPSLEAA